MKNIIAQAALVGCLAIPTGAAAQDAQLWQGFSAGLSLHSISPEFSTGFFLPLDQSYTAGVYGGYDHAVAPNVVIGARLRYVGDTDFDIFPAFQASMNDTFAIQGRAGYALGNVLFYGTIGYAMTDVGVTGSPKVSADGFLYGVGLDAMVAQDISVGLEYVHGSFSPSAGLLPPGVDLDTDVVTLSVGYHF